MDNAGQLLQSIIEDPRDIDTRRVYADFLIEQHDPRGEFIHTQCDLDQLDPYDPSREELVATEARLLKKHRTAWGRELKKYATAVEFRRGFAEHVSVKAEKLIEVAPTLFSKAPIRSLKLCGDREALKMIRQCEQLLRVEDLSVSSMRLGARYGEPLFQSPVLRNIVSLNVSHNSLGVRGLQPVLGCRYLDCLESLNLDDNRLDTPGLTALADSTLLSRLQHLSLNECRVRAPGVVALAHSNRLGNLKSLSLRRGFVGDEGMSALSQSDGFRPRHLDVELAHVGHRGISDAVHSGMFECVESLSLFWNNNIGDEGARVLARASMPNLRYVNLSRIGMTDRGGAELLAAPWIKGVRELEIWDNQLGLNSMRALARNPGMKTIVKLTLFGRVLPKDAISQLARTPYVSSLRKISTPAMFSKPEVWQPLKDSRKFPHLQL